MRVALAAALALVLAGAACSSAPSGDNAAPIGDGVPRVGVEPGQSREGGGGEATTPSTSRAAGPPRRGAAPSAARPSGTPAPASTPSGSDAPPAAPPNGPAEQDQFDRRAHLPDGAVRVAGGRTEQAEWRLYAYRDKGRTCLHFATQSSTSGGAGATCEQRPPLDRSVSESSRGRFGWGLVSAEVAKVRFEHGGGGSETFDTAGSPGYAERFYAGAIAATPITRIVALDAKGRVVAERTDSTTLNM